MDDMEKRDVRDLCFIFGWWWGVGGTLQRSPGITSMYSSIVRRGLNC